MMYVAMSEWTLLRKSSFTWFCLALLAILSGAQVLSAYGLIKLGYVTLPMAVNPLRAPNFLFMYVLPSNITFGIPLIIFLSSISIGGGYTWGTIRWPVEVGYSRNQIILGKTITITLISMIGGLVNIVLGCLMGLMVNRWLGFPLNGWLSLEVICTAMFVFFATSLAFWAYETIITMLAIWSRSTLFALCIGLLLFLLEYLLSQVIVPGAGPWDRLRPISLLGNTYLLVKPQAGVTMPEIMLLPLLVVVIHGFIWINVAQFIFRRQDISY